ncbi:MAG: metallophosphoesterase, partial [Myxococcota bacterium]|nr:metallophosphoesterase [Myxococcota bacterium]
TGDDDTTPDDPYIQPVIYVTPETLVPGETATVHYFGSLAQEDDLWLHYGFNGWNQVDGVGQLISDEGGGDLYLRAEMNPVIDGFEVTVDLPTDGRAMHFVFFTLDNEGLKTWDNNEALDYHQSIVFPYIGPLLTHDDGDPTESAAVNFETSVPCLGRVDYGPSAALGQGAMGDDVCKQHHIPLTGLPADTVIHYRVWDSLDHVSTTYTFRTADDGATALTFAAISDMQDYGEGPRWRDVAQHLVDDHPDLELIVLPGDMSASDAPGQWWTFFDGGRELLASAPVLPVPGNHDTPGMGHNDNTTSFEAYFALPQASGSETYYRIDRGPAAFLGLDSEAQPELATGEVQYLWVESELTDIDLAGTPGWVFVLVHVPPYNAGTRHAEAQHAVRVATEVFDGSVDWVFAGHEHLYQRTLPLRFEANIAPSGLYGRGVEDGVGYLVLPPAGQHQGDTIVPPESPDAARREWLAFPELDPDQTEVDSELGYMIVQLDGDAITLETWWVGTMEVPASPHMVDVVSYTR